MYVMPFGKYKGQPLSELDTGYLEWLIAEDFAREPLRSRLHEELRARTEIAPAGQPMILSIIDTGYRVLAKKFHPDMGGTHDQMIQLTDAVDKLRRMFKK